MLYEDDDAPDAERLTRKTFVGLAPVNIGVAMGDLMTRPVCLPATKRCPRCGVTQSRKAYGTRTLANGTVVLAPYDKACMQSYKKTWHQTRKLNRTASLSSTETPQ